MGNPTGYLFRVGQTAARRARPRPLPVSTSTEPTAVAEWFDPRLLPALSRLSEQQRTVVVLVHAYGWSQREVAELLGLSPSTVRAHLERALTHLRTSLEASDAR